MKQAVVQDVGQQLQAAIFSSGLTTKLICLFCVIGYGLSFSPQCVHALAVIPGRVMPPNFWIWYVSISDSTKKYDCFLFSPGLSLRIVSLSYTYGTR